MAGPQTPPLFLSTSPFIGYNRCMGKLTQATLPTGQTYFMPKRGFGMIFYPSLPETEAWPDGFIPDYQLTHPDDWPTWLQNIHSEHAAVQIRDGKVIWLGGTIHDGIFFDGLFHGGRWRDGVWMNGVFRSGIWSAGEFYAGHFMGEWLDGTFFGGRFSGIWRGGIFHGGEFDGVWLGGTWMGGRFNGLRERTTVPPSNLSQGA